MNPSPLTSLLAKTLVCCLATCGILLALPSRSHAQGSESGSSPLTIIPGTSLLDQDASTSIYPADDSQLLLENGNFIAPNLPAGQTGTSIPAYQAGRRFMAALSNCRESRPTPEESSIANWTPTGTTAPTPNPATMESSKQYLSSAATTRSFSTIVPEKCHQNPQGPPLSPVTSMHPCRQPTAPPSSCSRRQKT